MKSAAVSRPWRFNERTQLERESLMAIVNALAGIMVSDPGSATEVRVADEQPPARRQGHRARPCGGQSRSTTLRRELLIFSAPL
jgi:hypothetical protein